MADKDETVRHHLRLHLYGIYADLMEVCSGLPIPVQLAFGPGVPLADRMVSVATAITRTDDLSEMMAIREAAMVTSACVHWIAAAQLLATDTDTPDATRRARRLGVLSNAQHCQRVIESYKVLVERRKQGEATNE